MGTGQRQEGAEGAEPGRGGRGLPRSARGLYPPGPPPQYWAVIQSDLAWHLYWSLASLRDGEEGEDPGRAVAAAPRARPSGSTPARRPQRTGRDPILPRPPVCRDCGAKLKDVRRGAELGRGRRRLRAAQRSAPTPDLTARYWADIQTKVGAAGCKARMRMGRRGRGPVAGPRPRPTRSSGSPTHPPG